MSFTVGLMELVGVEQVPGCQCGSAQTLQGNSNERDLGSVSLLSSECDSQPLSGHRERLGNGWGAGMPQR